jgi:hypothetical protein
VRTFLPLARVVVALVAVLLIATASAPAVAAPSGLTPIEPTYRVRLRSGPLGRVWHGSARVTFRNGGSEVLDRVYLRLWSNGVQGCDPVAIRVRGLRGGTPRALRQRCTTLAVDLDRPLAPGERGEVSFGLSIRVPELRDRFGWSPGLAFLGSALPALAVRDDRGWHLPPFVDLGESFYSVVGRYRVTFETPRGIRTPSTGRLVARRTVGGRTVVTSEARRVRDFEWAAGPLRRVVGRAAGTRIVVWYLPEAVDARRARSLLGHAERAMATFSEAFGLYPYPELDVVLSGHAWIGGMEYPQIVFSDPIPVVLRHELAHQWWYGLVGNDQFTEPWLDEAFATWSQRLPTRPRVGCEGFGWPSGSARMTNDMGYWREHPAQYFSVVYIGGACLLAQLAERFGLDRFLRILERYAARHRYGIARTSDFVHAIDRAAARHLPGFDTDAFWAAWRVGP